MTELAELSFLEAKLLGAILRKDKRRHFLELQEKRKTAISGPI
jgi:hypothetical protein